MALFGHLVLHLLLTIHVCLATPSANSLRKRINLEDRYHYIIVGSDHVAQSIGLYLARSSSSKTILVLQSSQCEQILESTHAPDRLGLKISNVVAECAHRLGYQFTDPLRHGQRVGIAVKNRTRGLDIAGQHTLWAVDPNLQLLSAATVSRLLYNHASSSVLGVELELNGAKQCIFADEEVVIAGRCLNDYKHLSRGSIVPEVTLDNSLRSMPLDLSMGCPIMAPIFYKKVNATLHHSPTLLGTELYLRTPECNETNRAKPNVKLRMAMGNANLERNVWLGFIPSIISDDPNNNPDHEETVKMLAYLLKAASSITEDDAFTQLKLTALDQRIPECRKYVGSGQYWTCFVDVKLKRFKSTNVIRKSSKSLLDKEFRLKGVKSLRVLPIGLTAPFLDWHWKHIFTTKEEDRSSKSTVSSLEPGILARKTSSLSNLKHFVKSE